MAKMGGLNVLITNPRDIPGFIKELAKHRYNMITGVNTLFNAFLNNPDFHKLDFSHVKISVGGGMAVQKAVAERWKQVTGKVLLEGYGLTETSPVATMNPPSLPEYNGSIGFPVPSTYIAIRDDNNNDVAIGLHTPLAEAEVIKTMFGSVYTPGGHDGVSIEVPGLANRSARMAPRQELFEILRPRAQEVLGLAVEEMRRADLDPHLGAGVVLLGGGSRLSGLCDLTEQVFSGPARIGLPSDVLAQEGLLPGSLHLPAHLDGPEHTTVMALLFYGLRLRQNRLGRARTAPKGWKGILGRKAREGVR